ncbi:MAG: serine/threonine-protein kinase, partial [Aureliella sp.]
MNASKLPPEGSDSTHSASSDSDPRPPDARAKASMEEPRDLGPVIEQQLEELAGEFLTRLRQDGTAGYEALVDQYPELAPHLEARLKFYTAIYRVSRLTELTDAECNSEKTVDFSAGAASRFFREKSIRISCPHCGNLVQVVSQDVNEVVCDSCGSSVNLETNRRRQSMETSSSALPDRLGHFKIVRVLGEGGFGIVYLAEDQQLDSRQVAIKIPRHGFFGDSGEEQRFFREARNVARLKHPNIAQVYEISEDRNTPFIVSEFIDGLTLRDLSKGVKLTPLEVVKLLIQIVEAVEFAHQNKIIHRDLKSSNILVDRNRNAFVVDFGLSRRDDPEITMTLAGAVVGTVQYMSPEQAVGNNALVGPASDVYSLGVILYELLCAELPFHGTKRMTINQVIYEEPRRPRQLNENIPRDLETITLKAMAKKPSQRYASAQDFADDLRRWSRNEPIRARPVIFLVHWWSWCRRHPTTAMLSAAIAALLLLSSSISTIWAIEQSRLKNAESTPGTESTMLL